MEDFELPISIQSKMLIISESMHKTGAGILPKGTQDERANLTTG